MRHQCIGYDRIIDTDLPIRGTLPLPGTDASGRAIRVRWRDAVDAPGATMPIWSTIDGALCFAPPAVARYLITDETIDVIPLAGGDFDMLDALLIATALPALMWRQGLFVVHAAAVVPPGENAALAIAGASGSGKSTLVAAFAAKGAALVADDSIAVEAQRNAFVCAGLAGGYHLARDIGEERQFHAMPAAAAYRRAPLRAIVILDPGPCRARGSRLPALEALRALLVCRHRPNVPRYLRLEARMLDVAAHIIRAVPIYRWPRHEAAALLDERMHRRLLHGTDRKTRCMP